MTLISQSQPAAAIQVLDGLIDGFESRYRGSPQRIYSARSQAEALFYMLQASNEKRNARAIGPEWGQAQYIKGYELIDLGRLAQAHAALERAVDLAPANAQYRSELGHVYQFEKHWPKALDTFTEAERDASFSPDKVKTSDRTHALRGQGYALVEMGRLDEAESRYRRCLELDPGDKMARAELGFIAQRRARTSS